MKNQTICGLVPTYNSATTILATLESLKWVDEIVIVDSFSTDSTMNIVKQYTDKILQHEYINSASQKNWALSECTSRWIFQLDSDEIVTQGLKEEIASALSVVSDEVDAFRIPRMNLFLGKWMKHGGNYPDYQKRLFRRGCGRWEPREVHAHVESSGIVATLQLPIIHHDWPTLSKMLDRLDRYTRYEADELTKKGVAFRWTDLILRPIGIFLYRYIWCQGFRDGGRGLVFSVYMSIYDFLTRAKLWEMNELGVKRSPR